MWRYTATALLILQFEHGCKKLEHDRNLAAAGYSRARIPDFMPAYRTLQQVAIVRVSL